MPRIHEYIRFSFVNSWLLIFSLKCTNYFSLSIIFIFSGVKLYNSYTDWSITYSKFFVSACGFSFFATNINRSASIYETVGLLAGEMLDGSLCSGIMGSVLSGSG